MSRVINNRDRVDSDTRNRVLQAIDALGYVKNPLAASIKTGKSHFILAVVPDLVNDFYSDVVCGVEQVASEKGYYTLVYTTNNQFSKERSVYNPELEYLAEGMILIPSISNYPAYKNISKPQVIIDSIPSDPVPYSVEVDNYHGSKLLVEELIKYGHKKIAFICGPQIYNIGMDRFKGFIETLSSNGIQIQNDYIKLGSWYEEDGYRFTKELISLSDPPTAIFAANNLISIGCIECLSDNHMSIGKDISLVSFDDTQFTKYSTPGITAIQRPTNEMGSVGARMLFSIIENHTDEIKEKATTMPVKLIRRNSVAKLE